MPFQQLHDAFKAGDLEALRAAADDPSMIPDGPMSREIGCCLEYAIYHSPLSFIRTLLELGANPTPADHAGFPPLIAALTCGRSQRGVAARSDVIEMLELLIEYGADPDQRGVNDYTALHMAVAEDNAPAIRLLLARGADASLRTRIDACETPREMAERSGLLVMADMLRAPVT